MTVRDVSVYLNVNEKTVYRLAQKGELPAFKVAGAWRFRPEDLESWIAGQKATELRDGSRGNRSTTRERRQPSQDGGSE